jgi:glycogen(starch) synthase
VLHVSWEYPPLVYGGLGRHVDGLSRAQAAAGLDVTVLTPRPDPGVPEDERSSGVRVVRAPAEPSRLELDGLLSWVLAMQQALVRRAEQTVDPRTIDVVHTHDWVGAHAGVQLAEAWDRPLVATVHATEAGLWNGWITSPFSRARHDIETWLVRSAGDVVVCSRAMRDEVVSLLGADATTVSVVPNGVDEALWSQPEPDDAAVRDRLGLPPTGPLLALAGRVEWEKGGHVAVAALPRILAEQPAAHLVVVGVGSRLDALKDMVQRHRLSASVTFTGRALRRDLAALLRQAAVSLTPSSYEPFGIVALESMAAGTPVVAGDVGGLRDPVHPGRTGLLVPPQDADALAEAVLLLLRDAGLRRRLGRSGQDQVRSTYTWPAVATATTHVYLAAVDRRKAPGPSAAAVGDVPTGEAVSAP